MPILRHALPAASAMVLAASLAASPATDATEPPAAEGAATAYEAVDVTDGVVMAVHRHGSNLTCIKHGGGLVFVDASLSTRLAARFRSDMEERFDLPTRALVLTHAHMDHVLGMGAFADVPVVAAAPGKGFMERLASFEWNDEAIASYTQVFPTFADVVGDAKPFVPTEWFDDTYQLGTDEDPLIVRRTGGHTACSSNLWQPRSGVVVAGDLVQARRRPYFGDRATDLDLWMAALQQWLDEGATRFCPGHGPAIGREELTAIRAYFVDLTAALADLKARGVTLEAAVQDPSLPAGYWPAEEQLPRWWPSCIAAAWRGLEAPASGQ